MAGERRPSADAHEAAAPAALPAPGPVRSVAGFLSPVAEVERTLRPVDPDTGESTDEDGRRARRERNRNTVVESLLELFAEGNLAPSSDEIAERAGLSARSLFRYFDDVDDLARAAIVRQRDRVLPLVAIEVAHDAPLSVRIDALVAQRVRLFEALGPVGQVSRLRAPFRPLIAEELSLHRKYLRSQLRQLFRPELDALDVLDASDSSAASSASSVSAAGVLAMLDVLCSFESYHLLRRDQMLTLELVTAAMTASIRRLLAPVTE